MTKKQTTLVATLGFAPQIITRALDLFAESEQQVPIDQVVLIHTSGYRSHPDWPLFDDLTTYLRDHYQIEVQCQPIVTPAGELVDDIKSAEDAEHTFETIFSCVRDLKQKNHTLHGLLAGGRKSMIVYMMVAAQLLFTEGDQLWHLFSQHDSSAPHAEHGESRLVDIPTFHMASVMPMMHSLIVDSENPALAMRLYRPRETPELLHRLQSFYQYEIDNIDRSILNYAYHNYSNKEIADRVGLTVSAVSRRLNSMAKRFYPHKSRKYSRLRLLGDLTPILRQQQK